MMLLSTVKGHKPIRAVASDHAAAFLFFTALFPKMFIALLYQHLT